MTVWLRLEAMTDKDSADREETDVPAKESTDEDADRDKVSKDDDAFVDETSKDSFPTSDPPAW